VVVAVNKMDLVDYREEIFRKIEQDFAEFAKHLRFLSIYVVPLVAKDGDNLVKSSAKMEWHKGPPLLTYLEGVAIEDGSVIAPFRYPVQWVNRPSHDFRGFSGFVCGGNVQPGDIVRILPLGRDTQIARIVTYDGDLDSAVSGQSVTLTLTEEIDISRGDLFCSPVSPAKVGDRLKAKLLWLVREPLALDKSYLLKIGSKTTPAIVKAVTARIEIETGLAAPLREEGETLAFNAIGEAELTLDSVVVCDPYLENRETGGFILIDRITNETVAVGMVESAQASERGAPALLELSYSSMEGLPTPPASTQTRRRSLAKALSWRLLGSVLTFLVVFGFTRDLGLSLAITATEALVKIAVYYLHEEVWSRYRYGIDGADEEQSPPDDMGL
jgi:sulfate adenylyltransferase subunit 1 (EFTu-like GTPase family)/uncharacterized membrane protein